MKTPYILMLSYFDEMLDGLCESGKFISGMRLLTGAIDDFASRRVIPNMLDSR